MEPWTLANCCEYIEWCHIGKVFPEDCHNKHWRFTKANLKYCLDAKFKQRCIEVYQVLYNHGTLHKNEVSYTICQIVWAELKLEKVVDWRTLKAAPSIHIPTEQDIPRGVLKFPGGRLSIRTQVEKPKEYKTSNSDPNSDFDGSQPLKLSNNPAAVASRILWMRKRGRDDEQLLFLHPPHLHVVPHIPDASNMVGASITASTSNIAGMSFVVGASNMVGASDATGASDTAATSVSDRADMEGMPLLIAIPSAGNAASARATASTDNIPDAR